MNEPAARLTLSLISAAIPDVTLRILNRDADSPSLIVSIDIDQIRSRKRSVKNRIRSSLPDELRADYGLSDVRFPADPRSQSIVVLIHGFNSTPESMSDLDSFLLDRQQPNVQFRYPNDGPLIESVQLLSRELRSLKDAYPQHTLVLVGHSMGGLVARGVVELPEYSQTPVSRLIMVATPNHGSKWAQIPAPTEVLEALAIETSTELRLTQFIDDGLNEARTDLRPHSNFLRQLNACSRARNVDYTIIAGTAGVLTDHEYSVLQTRFDRLLRRSETGRFLRPLANGFVQNLDEVVTGKGDGVVSLASSRLDGVDDFVTLPMFHWDIDGPSRVTQQLFEEVNRRLEP